MEVPGRSYDAFKINNHKKHKSKKKHFLKIRKLIKK